MRHCGDQRLGAAAGDDEQIVLSLAHVHPAVSAIGIVINSYSGQAAAVAVAVAVAAVGVVGVGAAAVGVGGGGIVRVLF